MLDSDLFCPDVWVFSEPKPEKSGDQEELPKETVASEK